MFELRLLWRSKFLYFLHKKFAGAEGQQGKGKIKTQMEFRP